MMKRSNFIFFTRSKHFANLFRRLNLTFSERYLDFLKNLEATSMIKTIYKSFETFDLLNNFVHSFDSMHKNEKNSFHLLKFNFLTPGLRGSWKNLY
jgi:hypothetical protein